MDLEGAIAKLTGAELETMMDAVTREKIRAFVLAGREEPAPATVSALSPPVEGVAQAAKLMPGEPEVEPVMETASGESVIEGDVDEPWTESTV
jgi:hypothetical protein